MEVSQSLYDEAYDLNFALYRNAVAWTEIVDWADGWIVRLEQWPDEITEISLNGKRKDSAARHALALLAQQGNSTLLPVKLIQSGLQQLLRGRDPFQIVSELYPLVYEEFTTGGLEFSFETPEPIRTSLYTLDHEIDATDPLSGWHKMPAVEREKHMRERVREELTKALREVGV